jgi:hypothetical protein
MGTARSSHSLAYVVAFWTAAALASGMTVWALVQYVAFGPVDPWSLAASHLLHVAVVIAAVYGVLSVVLRVEFDGRRRSQLEESP